MVYRLTTLLVFVAAAFVADEGRAEDAAARTVTIQGSVVDLDGHPVTQGSLYVSITGKLATAGDFSKETTTKLGPDGRYRIEFQDALFASQIPPASLALRYIMAAPGFRVEEGRPTVGSESVALDLRLTPEAWKTTAFKFVDRRSQPVGGADVQVQLAGRIDWTLLQTDPEGRCRVSMPPGIGFGMNVSSRNYLPISFSFRASADGPTEVAVPMFDPIRGRVVDPAGAPLKGVRIGCRMYYEYDEKLPGDQQSLFLGGITNFDDKGATDDQGLFDVRPPIHLSTKGMDRTNKFMIVPVALCFGDETLKHMAFLGIDLNDSPPFHEVVLKSASHVRIPLEHEVTSPAGRYEGNWLLYIPVRWNNQSGQVMSMLGDWGRRDGNMLETYCPEGRYRLFVSSRDPVSMKVLEETTIDFDVPAGGAPLTLPKQSLPAPLLLKLVGKPAPEIDARDLDTGNPVRLADFRGKVVVLDFWGYWCGPCVGSMPDLMKLQDRYKDRPVVILALHDQSIQTRAAYDRELAGVKRLAWNGRDLPFRVAVDAPSPDLPKDDPGTGRGITCDRYEIDSFPSTLVIGPDGVIVGKASARTPGALDALIDRVLPPAAP
ncbi:TlpA family protein disulfide reductase [Paludisphaera rhizosphaerae]|uniref:TlpA family protein disulfide reductase n=1 Tax=Paludisphaera rhizosphaerae TaxID=2711216 RepID=UPI0013ED70E9|nr:redoxin family protein [Paludisphaera rhizosphaerae]